MTDLYSEFLIRPQIFLQIPIGKGHRIKFSSVLRNLALELRIIILMFFQSAFASVVFPDVHCKPSGTGTLSFI